MSTFTHKPGTFENKFDNKEVYFVDYQRMNFCAAINST